MTISGFVAYIKQAWKNKPDTSTPISAERLLHLEDGIKGNSDAIEKIAAAVISQITNDPNKIASMAALFAVNEMVTQVNRDLTLKTGTVAVTSHITDGAVYVERVGNVVHLYCRWELTLTGSPGTGVTLFTIPEGFRPYRTHRTPAQLDYSIGVRPLEIATSGAVSLQGSGAGNATSLLFDAVYFTN